MINFVCRHVSVAEKPKCTSVKLVHNRLQKFGLVHASLITVLSSNFSTQLDAFLVPNAELHISAAMLQICRLF